MSIQPETVQSSYAHQDLLIIGSLPPIRSNAALLTHTMANMLTKLGVSVTCLIDALAPPPARGRGYQVARPYDPPQDLARLETLPRLYVIGGGGDSFSALEVFETAPGPVILAEQSLFPLLLPALEKKGDAGQHFWDLMEQKFGENGKIIANTYINHRRLAHSLNTLLPAFDILLGSAPKLFAANTQLMHNLMSNGLNALPLQIANQPRDSNTTRPQSPPSILILGASEDVAEEIERTLKGVNFTLSSRYDSDVFDQIDAADIVAILDGHEAATCPLLWHAAQELKSLITCGQPWANDLPRGAHQSCPPFATDVFHAVTALATSTQLAELQRHTLESWLDTQSAASAQQRSDFLGIISKTPDQPLKMRRPMVLNLAQASNDATAEITLPVSGPVALIGAVASPPILKSWLPDLDTGHSPKFITSEIAQALADFLGEPQLRLVDEMGFEAPVIHEGNEPAPENSKLKSWNQIEPDLLMARFGLSMGTGTLDGVHPAPSSEDVSASWAFDLSALAENPKQSRGFNPNTGMYWKLDRLRGGLALVFFTGSSGMLSLTAPNSANFVVTDMTQTLVCSAGASVKLNVTANGIVHLKVTLLPETGKTPQQIETVLASQALVFNWRACKISSPQDTATAENKLK